MRQRSDKGQTAYSRRSMNVQYYGEITRLIFYGNNLHIYMYFFLKCASFYEFFFKLMPLSATE